jgi:hypothetical protein
MKKLIETHQENSIECDNPLCDFVILNETEDPNAPIDKYLNQPCPKCGENLLTQEDLDAYIKGMKIINFLNRWFSWLTIFRTKKSKMASATMTSHKGLKIEIDE